MRYILAAVIVSRLPDTEYLCIQSDEIMAIKGFTTIHMTLDGTTNKCGKQMLNKMGAGPLTFFLGPFKIDLKPELANNLLTKLLASRGGLLVALDRAQCDGVGGFIEPLLQKLVHRFPTLHEVQGSVDALVHVRIWLCLMDSTGLGQDRKKVVF